MNHFFLDTCKIFFTSAVLRIAFCLRERWHGLCPWVLTLKFIEENNKAGTFVFMRAKSKAKMLALVGFPLLRTELHAWLWTDGICGNCSLSHFFFKKNCIYLWNRLNSHWVTWSFPWWSLCIPYKWTHKILIYLNSAPTSLCSNYIQGLLETIPIFNFPYRHAAHKNN